MHHAKILLDNLSLRYLISYKHSDNKDDWFNKLKIDASLSGFCADMKEYKKNKEQYLGSISDAAALIRIALTNRLESPDLYEIQQVMGEERVNKRIERYLYSLRGRL